MDQILDAEGNKVGVPVKASNFIYKPTLGYQETKFKLDNTAGSSDRAR